MRQRLKAVIDSEYMSNVLRTNEREEFHHQGVIMQGFLVERESDESYDVAMRRGIDVSQVYVGVFGKEYSKATVDEYREAREKGLPLLVYYFTEPPQKAAGLHSKVIKFLEREVKPAVKIRGNFSRVTMRERDELIDQVLVDLAARVADLARESVAVRRLILEKAPPELLGAILRAKRSVFRT